MFSALKRCLFACFSPDFYVRSRSDQFGKRFFTLWLALVLVAGAFSFWSARYLKAALPELSKISNTFLVQIPKLFPENLVLSFKDGKLSSNDSQQHRIDYTSALPIKFEGYGNIVIDPSAQGINPAPYETDLLFGPEGISAISGSGRIEYRSYKELIKQQAGTLSIDRQAISVFADAGRGIVKWVESNAVLYFLIGMLLLSPIFALFLALWKLLILLLLSVMSWALCRILKRTLSFAEVYHASIYLAIPLSILQLIFFFWMTAPVTIAAYLLLFFIMVRPTAKPLTQTFER